MNNKLLHILLSLLMLLGASAVSVVSARDFVVTLDPGHGGKDFGAIGAKTNEKTVVLAVAKKLGKMIEDNIDDVKVVYTRKTDVFIPLDRRAGIANEAGSDLFISIHINSVDKKNKNRTRIEGAQVYTLGLHKTAENLAVAKRENASMEYEDNHSEKYAAFDPNSPEGDIVYELMQAKRMERSVELADAIHSELCSTAGRQPKGVRQAGFWVLWATSMPSVLVELDFICNPRSEKFLMSEDGIDRMATSLYNAFCSYFNTYSEPITGKHPEARRKTAGSGKKGDTALPLSTTTDFSESSVSDNEEPQQTGQSASDDEPVYKIQILASPVKLKKNSSELKGLENVGFYKEGSFYKYTYGEFASQKEAKKELKKVKKKFKDAFIVKMKGDVRVDFIKP